MDYFIFILSIFLSCLSLSFLCGYLYCFCKIIYYGLYKKDNKDNK